jgi:hypothetical protein
MATFKPEELKKLQKLVADSAVQIGKDIAEVDRNLSTAWTKTQQRFIDVMSNTKQTLTSWYAVAYEISSRGTVSGLPVTTDQADKFLKLGGRLVSTYSEAAQAVAQYAPTQLIKNAIADVAIRLMGIANKLFEGVADILDTAASSLGWIPWVIGAIVVGPLILKTFSGYKSGGARGAADAAAGELSRARSTLARKAKLSGVQRRRRSR